MQKAQVQRFFPTDAATTATSTHQLWIGRALSALPVLFLTFDSIGKLLQVPPVMEATGRLGYSAEVVFTLGLILITCVMAYVIPATSILGALLLTAYLGGAVATHVRVHSPVLTHVLFPTYIAAMLWAGLVLRDARLRVFIPLWRWS